MRWLMPLFLGFLSLALVACKEENATDTNTGTNKTVSVSSLPYVKRLGSGKINLDLTLSERSEVFLVLTNGTTSDITSTPTVNGKAIGRDMLAQSRQTAMPFRRRVPEQVTRFNNRPPQFVSQAPLFKASPKPGKPRLSVVGDALTFYEDLSGTTVDATLIEQRTASGITLNIWVADDAYTGCSLTYCMSSAMVTAFADKFLSSTSTTDIYNLATHVYGDPWGSHSYSNLMASTAASQIDILFLDIGSDDDSGNILGYFWAKDNYLASVLTGSNERLMFYIDSVYSAAQDGDSWEITDEWPNEMVGTLAHEFQHMIYFYQKSVQSNPADDTTHLNEMLSMTTEDLLANSLDLTGPYAYLSTLTYATDYSLADWYGIGANYGLNLSFGGYIMRNFGGPQLLRKIQHSGQGDYGAIVKSINDLGYRHSSGQSYDMDALLSGWAAANLLTGYEDAPKGYRLNKGKDFSFTFQNIAYSVPSLNLSYHENMLTYSTSNSNNLSGMSNMSNRIVDLGSLNGNQSITLSLPTHMTATLVVR